MQYLWFVLRWMVHNISSSIIREYLELNFLTFTGQKRLDGLAPTVHIINRFLRKATKSTLENYMEILHWWSWLWYRFQIYWLIQLQSANSILIKKILWIWNSSWPVNSSILVVNIILKKIRMRMESLIIRHSLYGHLWQQCPLHGVSFTLWLCVALEGLNTFTGMNGTHGNQHAKLWAGSPPRL